MKGIPILNYLKINIYIIYLYDIQINDNNYCYSVCEYATAPREYTLKLSNFVGSINIMN